MSYTCTANSISLTIYKQDNDDCSDPLSTTTMQPNNPQCVEFPNCRNSIASAQIDITNFNKCCGFGSSYDDFEEFIFKH